MSCSMQPSKTDVKTLMIILSCFAEFCSIYETVRLLSIKIMAVRLFDFAYFLNSMYYCAYETPNCSYVIEIFDPSAITVNPITFPRSERLK